MKRRFVLRMSGYVALVVLVTAGAAQSLAGSNTVFTDDIVDGQVTYSDIRDNAMTGKKILDNSVTGADLANNAVTGAKVVDGTIVSSDLGDGSVTRDDLGFEPIAGVTQVSGALTMQANQSATKTVGCPESNPVALGGGYDFGSTGLAVWSSVPVMVQGTGGGWSVTGTNTLPQPRNLVVWVVCGNDGSNG